MKGHDEIISTLNELLADELTAINQYMVHSEMCDDWGYARLHEYIEKRAIDEMKHAERLIGRVLFLEGMPVVTKLNEIHIGSRVDKQFASDRTAEEGAITAYNRAIQQCAELGDNGTREMLEHILEDEEAHIDWLEAQLDQIEHLGLENYLAEQVRS